MKKLLLIMGVFSLVSCKKFLQEYSQSDVTPRTVSDFGEILYSDGYPDKKMLLQPWMVFLDDDTQCYNAPVVKDQSIIRSTSAIFQWQPDFAAQTQRYSTGLSFNTWSTYYRMILGTNVVLQYLDGATGSQADKDQYKGEAYTLRAFYHFMLVNIYARPYNDSTTTPDKSPGVPLRTNANLSDAYLRANTVKEVYGQITSDLDSAIYLLGKQRKSREVYRISHVAAHLLASRVYLYMENWDKCIEHADAVLQYHPQLMDLNTWDGMPDPDNKPLIGQSNLETIWCYGQPEEQMPYSYSEVYELSHDLVNTFADNDLRKQTGFYINPEEVKAFLAPDFSQMKNVSSRNGRSEELSNSWRSAEAYLNRAEACIQKYKTKGDANAATQALISLNTLRASRMDKATFTPWSIQPAATLLQLCRDERRRELYREETHRWFDLRRYGMPAITHIYTPDLVTVSVYRLQARDPQYVIPIPDEVLARNPVLVPYPLYPGTRLPE